jgi:hypothetical protein
MKTVRIFVSTIIICIALSAWPPATASAQVENAQVFVPAASSGNYGLPKVAYVTVENKTGGILYVELKADQYAHEPSRRSYAFGFPNQGKIRFQILPGRYTYTIRSTNCGGKVMYTKFFSGETALGIYTCDKKNR